MRRREKYGRLSEKDRLEIGDRIWSGQTHAEAAAAVGCSTKSIQRLLTRTGGLAPRGRNRSPCQLTVAEREEISRGLRAGDSFRVIARRLGRAPSTISREVTANGSRQRYRAWRAERRAAEKARRPKVAKLARCPRLRRKVECLLAERWSPQQIAHRLRLDHPSDPEMWVSHETIYQSLYVQTRKFSMSASVHSITYPSSSSASFTSSPALSRTSLAIVGFVTESVTGRFGSTPRPHHDGPTQEAGAVPRSSIGRREISHVLNVERVQRGQFVETATKRPVD